MKRNVYCAEHEFTYPDGGSCFYCHEERQRRAQEIVGHKTFSDGNGGFRHEPLTRVEADALWASAIAAKEKRAADMPDVETALRVLTDAHQRLKELGFSEAQYGKKQNVMVELIEPGCSAVQRGYWRYHDGKDGAGCFWIPSEGDEWPSHPILSRALPTGGTSG